MHGNSGRGFGSPGGGVRNGNVVWLAASRDSRTLADLGLQISRWPSPVIVLACTVVLDAIDCASEGGGCQISGVVRFFMTELELCPAGALPFAAECSDEGSSSTSSSDVEAEPPSGVCR